MSSRTISVLKESSKEAERYSFPAVTVETSARQAKTLREAFFSQPKPSEVTATFPYTGPYQFVPMLQFKAWPIIKIFQLANVHVKLCDNLQVIYVQKLQDIRNEIGPQGHTLMKGFLGLAVTVEGRGTFPLIHSIHNTGRATVKAVLVHRENYDYAIAQLAAIQEALLSGVPQEYHANVFVDNLEAGLTGSQRDTIQSCNSSQQANELISLYNPQDAEVQPTESTKRFRPTVISYAAVATSSVDSSQDTTSQTTTQQVMNISSLTDQDLDQLYERLKHHINIVDDTSPGITTEEMERMVTESNNTILQVREEMRTSVADLKADVANIGAQVKKQNAVVVGVQKMLETTSQDLKDSVNKQVSNYLPK